MRSDTVVDYSESVEKSKTPLVQRHKSEDLSQFMMNKRRKTKLDFFECDDEQGLIGEKSSLPTISEFEKEDEGNSKQSASTNNTYITN